MYWSYLLAAVGIFGLYLAGNKVKWAWLVGAAAQLLWIAYAIATKQWGFIVSAVAYAWVYLRNHYRWNHTEVTTAASSDDKPSEASQNASNPPHNLTQKGEH